MIKKAKADASLRVECLVLATKWAYDKDAAQMLDIARRMYEWIKTGKAPKGKK